MRRSLISLVSVAALACATATYGDSITLNVFASSAPNGFGSAAWDGYCVNALNSLENGLGNIGDRSSDPTAYEIAPAVVEAGDIAATSFPSWRGVVNPAAPFNNEHGNRMHFGLHAYGDGTTQFSLEDLTFGLHSSDATDSLEFVGDFITYTYNGTTRYGINWGVDRVKGGGDDIVYTSGNGTTPVDELVYVGVGNAWWPGAGDPDPANPVGGAQAAMDEYLAQFSAAQPVEVSCTYAIKGYTGGDSVSVVPEPGTLALLGMSVLGLLAYAWRRR
jgi:hypothetical protein